MNLLLDTHSFLWFVNNSPDLSANARTHIADIRNDVCLSVVSAWEIAIKTSIGKLQIPAPVESFIPTQLTINDFQLLPIAIPHLGLVATFPFHHKDPFDRLLAAQSLHESMPIVSIDARLDPYGVQRIW
jgi:PIN domain nuclease of toxin-antitoxin system